MPYGAGRFPVYIPLPPPVSSDPKLKRPFLHSAALSTRLSRLLALSGLALAIAIPAQAAPAPARKPAAATAKKAAVKPKAKAKTKAKPKAEAAAPAMLIPTVRTEAANRVIAWIASSGDNQGLPFVIVDKPAARVFLFNAAGEQIADGPTLIGIALGDEATPGIGSKNLNEIGPAEKTTPAGRFLAKFGIAAGNTKVLWVDYATSVAMHMIPKDNKEHRRDRMLSPSIEDNRITYGCINVPIVFYGKVRPLFQKKGGYVYVLPDVKPIEEVFPRLRVQPYLNASASAS